jgi:immune inhibitor A
MFKRNLVFVFVFLAGFLFLAALPTGQAHASPAAPTTFTITQPDGTTFTAVLWGDETENGYETLEGYTIAQDSKSGSWYYLTNKPDGTLAPAYLDDNMMIVGLDSPAGLKKHLRPAQSSANQSITVSEDIFGPLSPTATGTQKVVVLLAGFPNATGRTAVTDWYNRIFGGYGSLRDYYDKVSYGALELVPAEETHGTVNDGIIGWFLTDSYTEHPNPGSSVSDVNKYIAKRALQTADDWIDFSDYDTDSNGSISTNELHIIVVVAGFERSYGGTDEPAVWAHNSDLSGAVGAPTLDGKIVANGTRQGYYNQIGEYHVDHMATVGVIAHVFGHDLIWPDLYDVDGSSSGIGDWSVMGLGCWNGLTFNGDSPAYPSAWEKWYQAWMTPTTISGWSIAQVIPRSEDNDVAFLLRPNPGAVDWTYKISSGQGEYYLVENRQQYSYDSGLPGEGLLIWHIDETIYYDGYCNANENHPLVKLIQADGLDDLKYKTNEGDAGDPYPGSADKRIFLPTTTPNNKLYNGSDSFARVYNISDPGATMTADLLYGYPIAYLNTLAPSYSVPSTEAFTLTVIGTDFYSNSVVRWNGMDRTTYYTNSTKLQALIPASDMIALGSVVGNHADVTVFNPQPGGGESDPRQFVILDETTIVPFNFLSMILKNFSIGHAYIMNLYESFEGDPSGIWDVSENGGGDYRWLRRDCRANAGVRSAWAVGGGNDGIGLACGSNYPEYADTSMIYGPFSTTGGVISGKVVYRFFLNSEPTYDYLWVTVGTGGSTEYGYKISGNSGGWIDGVLDLDNVDGEGTSVIGLTNVWLRFRFTSDYMVSTGEGAFLDDIYLLTCKAIYCSGYSASPSLTPIVGPGTQLDGLIVEPVMITTEP